MDNIIYFIYENGLDILLFLGLFKIIIILLYRFDISYVVVSFFTIFTHGGIEPNSRRKKFRQVHNLVTVIFYAVLLIWASVTMIVRTAG